MLIQYLIVETCITHGEAGKLTGVPVRILTARDCSFDKSMLEEFFIKVPCVTAQISNQVADLSSNACVFMADKGVELNVDVSVVDWFVELLRDSSQLRDQTQCVNNQRWWVFFRQKLEFRHCGQATSIHELFGKVTRFFSCEYEL